MNHEHKESEYDIDIDEEQIKDCEDEQECKYDYINCLHLETFI